MEDTLITVDRAGQKITLQIPGDTVANELMDCFRTIMTWLGYHRETIAEYLPYEDETYPGICDRTDDIN